MTHRITVLVTLLGLVLGQASWAADARLLDGRTFYGREKVKGGEERNQIYIFRDGTFEASWWAATGLKAGPYTARAEGDAILFTAETPGAYPETGPAHWQGKVVGNHIEVTGSIRNADQPTIEVSGQADLGKTARDALMIEQELQSRLREFAQTVPRGKPEDARILDAAAQKLTLSRIRDLGTALFSWLVDQVPRPGGAESDPGTIRVDLQAYPLVTAEQVRQRLVPRYLEKLYPADAWGHPIEMRVNLENLQGRRVFCLRSPGRDGRFSGDSYQAGSFPPGDFDQDIVWCDGWFVRWPAEDGKPAAAPAPH